MTSISFSPRDGSARGEVRDSTPAEVIDAVERAAAAAPAVAAASPWERRRWLHAVADAVAARAPELALLADEETALGMPRLESEVARMAAQLRFYADVAAEGSFLDVAIDSATAERPRLVRIRRPRGPVAVFGASNFPFAFGSLGNDTGSALAAGCPVVVKSHPAHPRLAERLTAIAGDALQRAGAPDGTLAAVSGFDAGLELVRAPGIRAVAFTGSQPAGMALWRTANERAEPIPVFAEMGTVNPVVVTRAAAARIDEIGQGFCRSFTLGAGQFCTKPGLLLAPGGTGAAAVVAGHLRTMAPEPVMLTEGIARAVLGSVAALERAGATTVARVGGGGAGWSAPAAVLRAPLHALTAGSALLEECFGPVALVVEYNDMAELAQAVQTLQPSLAASVFGGGPDDADAATVLDLLAGRVGRVVAEDWPTGVTWSWAQHHGGPWPATTAPEHTSVGAAALTRFGLPVTFQSTPDAWLPAWIAAATGSENSWGIPRRLDGHFTKH